MNKTFATYTFGCRVNEAETFSLSDDLINSGLIENLLKPDFYIINSCAVTGKAEKEVRQYLHQLRNKFPRTKIVLTGCAATLWKKQNRIPDVVDYCIENSQKTRIKNLLLNTNNIKTGGNKNLNFKDKFYTSGRLMIKIQDGCSRNCSYCIVPSLRGNPESRRISEIVTNIKIYEKNISEIILTAINTEFFGKENNESLTELVDTILLETKIPHISFGSINPWSITPEFLKWYENNSDNNRLVHFFHIPIQSGSNSMLKRMHRGYSIETIKDNLDKLHNINPLALIGTDIIVGFPGETKNEFQDTYNYLEQSPISKFHVFRYSVREGTLAEKLEKDLPKISVEIKHKRADSIRALGEKKYQKYLKSLSGKTLPVLFLVHRKNGFQEALTNYQTPLMIKSKPIKPGTIQDLKINSEYFL
jgi:threonylcarbamoyladenosine tRNA methylthiotransferase MtaB